MKAPVLLALLLASGAAAQSQTASQPFPAAVTAALADPARADQQGDDQRRQAAAVVAFSGARAGSVVMDFLPGQGYWTRIFSGVVGPRGHVFAAWPAASATRSANAIATLQGRGLANVTAGVQPTNLPTAARPVDVFWTVQNYHDIPNGGGGEPALRSFNQAVFRLLKKGGTFVVIDHADAAGTGMTGTSTKHRIDPALVKSQVQAAGFVFVGESKVLRNPADDHSLGVRDPSLRGRTDQFVYKFRKP
jgi:predicted methyltransferase